MEQRTLQLSGGGGQDKKSPLISEEEAKIRQDKLDTEKITSFVSIGGDSGRGVSIRFSERSEPRKEGVASSPGSSGSSSDMMSKNCSCKLDMSPLIARMNETMDWEPPMMTAAGRSSADTKGAIEPQRNTIFGDNGHTYPQ